MPVSSSDKLIQHRDCKWSNTAGCTNIRVSLAAHVLQLCDGSHPWFYYNPMSRDVAKNEDYGFTEPTCILQDGENELALNAYWIISLSGKQETKLKLNKLTDCLKPKYLHFKRHLVQVRQIWNMKFVFTEWY